MSANNWALPPHVAGTGHRSKERACDTVIVSKRQYFLYYFSKKNSNLNKDNSNTFCCGWLPADLRIQISFIASWYFIIQNWYTIKLRYWYNIINTSVLNVPHLRWSGHDRGFWESGVPSAAPIEYAGKNHKTRNYVIHCLKYDLSAIQHKMFFINTPIFERSSMHDTITKWNLMPVFWTYCWPLMFFCTVSLFHCSRKPYRYRDLMHFGIIFQQLTFHVLVGTGFFKIV